MKTVSKDNFLGHTCTDKDIVPNILLSINFNRLYKIADIICLFIPTTGLNISYLM